MSGWLVFGGLLLLWGAVLAGGTMDNPDKEP